MPYGHEAFFGTSVPDPGPKPFVKASGLRKFHCQTTFNPEGESEGSPGLSYRAYEMGNHAERAVRFFCEQEVAGVKVQWHTLAFSVRRTGMEGSEDIELWRWEVWAE